MSDEAASLNQNHNDDGNEFDEIALASVDEAISAVENSPAIVEKSEPKKQPTDRIPEIEDVEDPQEMVQVLLTVGEERSRRDDIKGALAAFNKAIALDPSCDMAWFNRGVLLEAQQDARGARQAFQICLDLNENHAPATANMAILLERIGDLEGAFEMAKKALSFFPGHPALIQLQNRCRNSGISVAMEAMQPSIQVTQEIDMREVEEIAAESGIVNPESLIQEAIHHDYNEDNIITSDELKGAAEVVVAQQEAMRDISEQKSEEVSVQSVPNQSQQVEQVVGTAVAIDVDDLVEKATELLKNGDAKQALALLKPHLKTVAAQHATAWRIAGGAMARLNLDNHAVAAMTHAQNLDPSHASGWFNLGSIHQRSGHISDAFNAYQKAISADPMYLKAAEKMMALAKEQGMIEHFLESSRMILKIDASHEVRDEFVKLLLSLAQGENDVLEQVSGLPPTLPAGPDMAREALQFLSTEPSAQRALALSLSQQHADSVMMWKTLIQANQTNPSHWSGLARALEQAGDLATAAKCHAKSAALSGSNVPQISQPIQATQQDTPNTATQSAPDIIHEQENTVEVVATSESTLYREEIVEELDKSPEDILMAEESYETQEFGQELHDENIDNEPNGQSDLLLMPIERMAAPVATQPQPEVDLAKAALDAAQAVAVNAPQNTGSHSISNQDVAWFNQGVQLIEDKKYREALSCFDRALPAFAGDDAMIIRILNNRGNAYYFLENYPKCVESYHQAMLIRPTEVRGETLYNMGTAYAEMERYKDAIKCFEQALPRGLSDEAKARTKDQIRRCNILLKEFEKKRKRK